ncbi:hypothetical protein ABZ816_02290 [Actinosynnema sp. NPDC047251]|uniref:Uncharacterized protein n=1 Tax=Saccharothrix espanaensis (strain ATCC 51144 / DSM 44229 / JCM 9112 / NBRC 15066 / NRRL 15764) TaxID=1179773 RepID=K0JY89_SACES|nr:hypothetical protein [Saccharothrix espanaensis]CCH31081.1 hypothetical protein BN6_37900 [Saccharothrix espanaensis DSM 44229]
MLIFIGVILLVVQLVVVIRYGMSDVGDEGEAKRRKALIVTTVLVLLTSTALFLTA